MVPFVVVVVIGVMSILVSIDAWVLLLSWHAGSALGLLLQFTDLTAALLVGKSPGSSGLPVVSQEAVPGGGQVVLGFSVHATAQTSSGVAEGVSSSEVDAFAVGDYLQVVAVDLDYGFSVAGVSGEKLSLLTIVIHDLLLSVGDLELFAVDYDLVLLDLNVDFLSGFVSVIDANFLLAALFPDEDYGLADGVVHDQTVLSLHLLGTIMHGYVPARSGLVRVSHVGESVDFASVNGAIRDDLSCGCLLNKTLVYSDNWVQLDDQFHVRFRSDVIEVNGNFRCIDGGV